MTSIEEFEEVLDKLAKKARWGDKYTTYSNGCVNIQLRNSILRRRRNTKMKDFDVVQISVSEACRGKGLATTVIKQLIHAARRLGRGIYLEEAFTKGGKALANHLVRAGVMYQVGKTNNYLSYVSPLGLGGARRRRSRTKP